MTKRLSHFTLPVIPENERFPEESDFERSFSQLSELEFMVEGNDFDDTPVLRDLTPRPRVKKLPRRSPCVSLRSRRNGSQRRQDELPSKQLKADDIPQLVNWHFDCYPKDLLGEFTRYGSCTIDGRATLFPAGSQNQTHVC